MGAKSIGSEAEVVQDGDEVILTVEERATGARYDIRSRHVIACDGARSKVRNLLQIESDGEDSCKRP